MKKLWWLSCLALLSRAGLFAQDSAGRLSFDPHDPFMVVSVATGSAGGIIRGGSYYHPTESIWYVTGGPLLADHPEILLLIAPGLNRNATVGFRCVRDSEQ